MNRLVEELKKLKYFGGSELEKQVEALLKKLGIKYIPQPNGTQKYPDFYLSDLGLNLECKSSATNKPMWNCTYPKKDGLYIIACKKFETCIVKFGNEIVTDEIIDLYNEYSERHKALEVEINRRLLGLQDNKYYMKVFARNMFVQSIGFSESIEPKKDLGQYFTISPDILSKLLNDYNGNPVNVLEPSCGIGSLLSLVGNFENVTAVDIDSDVLNISETDYPGVHHILGDFLTIDTGNTCYDLIIGNPPYFEIAKNQIPDGYSDITYGRVNIYYLFLYKCINMLNIEGELRFIIPSSFLSNRYAQKCREYLLQNCQIIDIVFFDNDKHFENATQDVIILKCKKVNSPQNHHHILNPGSVIVKDVSSFSTSNVSIKSLGCTVKTGTVVWNKEQLSDTTGVFLYYSSDISQNEQTNILKKRFLKVTRENKYKVIFGPCILVQRIFSENIGFKFIEYTSNGFFVENHVNVISGPVESLKIICNSFKDTRTGNFIRNVLRSNHISKNELENLIRIYV